MILSAQVTDAKYLTEIALQSKAFWGYADDLLKTWQNDLTVTCKMIKERTVFTYIDKKEILGFYMLNLPKNNISTLEMLFVLPSFIGKGIGTQLLLHSFNEAKKMSAKRVILLADPNAERFYKKQGFRKVDKKESQVNNRFLPVMLKELDDI